MKNQRLKENNTSCSTLRIFAPAKASIMSSSDIQYDRLCALTSGDYQAFLYDCDGTLADNMKAHTAAYVEIAQNYGIELDGSIIDELAGWPTVQVCQEIGKRYKIEFDS